MENGTLLVDVALVIRMMIPACESVKCQVGNCIILASQLKLLKQLFDELRQSKFPLSDATVSAFEMLQLTLLKAKDVVGRCAGGSKLYSVLRGPQLVSEFQELSREMERLLSASALVLPRVSKQSQYLAEKCIMEFKKANFSKDLLEEQVRQEIESLLVEHRGGRKASHEKLQSLAGYLGISTKEEIASEFNALEKAANEARANRDKKEEDFIDQVISMFMQLQVAEDDFDDGDTIKTEHEVQQEVQIPADFRCPLSLELMYDPVIVASGQTYERAYIQHWLDQGNTRCPKTGQPLAYSTLIPNYTVKALIANWCQTNGVPLPKVDTVKPSNWFPPTFMDTEDLQETSNVEAGEDEDGGEPESKNDNDVPLEASGSGPIEGDEDSAVVLPRQVPAVNYSSELSGELNTSLNSLEHFPIYTRQQRSPMRTDRKPYKKVDVGYDGTAEAGIELMIQDLQSEDPDVQRNAAAELRLVAKINTDDRIRIANAGGIKHLVALLSSPDKETQENAVTALLNLSLNNSNKAEIAEAGAIDPLIEVLKHGTCQAKENAAATLFSLSVKEDYKEAIGERGAIPLLADLLKSGTPRGKKDAATALYNLSLFHNNKIKIVEAGAVRPLIELICEPKMGMVDRAVLVIATLSTIPEGRFAIGEEGGIPPLVEVIEAGSLMAKENAAASLFQLCSSSPRYRNLALQEGAVPPLYILCQTGTPRAKEKAAGILRLFREQRQASMSRHPGSRHL